MNTSIDCTGVKLYVDLIKSIDDLSRSNKRTYVGTVKQENKNKVSAILEKLNSFISISSPTFPSYDDEDGEIILKLPSFYNFSLKEMLEDHPELRCNILAEPTYFEDIDYIYTKTNLDDLHQIEHSTIVNYVKSVHLYSLIKTQADHVSENKSNEETLYFLGPKKFSIVNDLTVLEDLSLDSIRLFKNSYIDSTIHKDAINQIIKNSIVNYYASSSEISINQFCNDFHDIYTVIQVNYDTYMSEFTFSKVQREVEKFRTETVTRINKALADIQMQIVTIPASVVIVAGNFKSGKDFSLTANSVILFGAFFFALAVYFICENQKDTLNNIHQESLSHKSEVEKNPQFPQSQDILNNYTIIETRYQSQLRNLLWIKVGVSISFLITLIIYIALNYEYSCLNFSIPLMEKFQCNTVSVR